MPFIHLSHVKLGFLSTPEKIFLCRVNPLNPRPFLCITALSSNDVLIFQCICLENDMTAWTTDG